MLGGIGAARVSTVTRIGSVSPPTAGLLPWAGVPILKAPMDCGISANVAMRKQEVLDILRRFPDQFDPELLMYELYVKAKLERAEAAVAKGDVVSHDEAIKRSRQWFD